MLPSLSVVIPAYNEEENIEWFVEDIIKTAPSIKFVDLEIIIVEDGSTDETGIIADRLSNTYKEVKVVHQKNNGYCKALLKGIKDAKMEYVAYMPADGQTLLRDIKECLPYLGKADLILGDRGKKPDYSLYRLLLSYGYLFLIRLFFGVSYKDINWFHIWKTEKIQRLKTISNSVFLHAETTILFRDRGYSIVEAKVPYRSRRLGEAKLSRFSYVGKTLIDLLIFWFQRQRNLWYNASKINQNEENQQH